MITNFTLKESQRRQKIRQSSRFLTLTTLATTREKVSGLCEKGTLCKSAQPSQDPHSQKRMRHVAFITDHLYLVHFLINIV